MADGASLFLAGTPYTSVRQALEADLRRVVAEGLARDEARLTDTVDAIAGSKRYQRYSGPKPRLANDMGLDEKILIVPVGAFGSLDLAAIARSLLGVLVAATPVLSGHLRGSYRFTIGDQVLDSLPADARFSIVGVINIAAYASVNENPGWTQPYRRAWTWIARKAREDGFDARFRYRLETGEQVTTRQRGTFSYPAPIIEIGYLNTMRGRTGRLARVRPASRKRTR